MARSSRAAAATTQAPACHFTVTYCPPDYGDITPADECCHAPQYRFDLGFRLEKAKRGKGRQMVRDGWFCLKCGAGHLDGAQDWWDTWEAASHELRGKHWRFDCRLTELAEFAAGTSDLRKIHQMLFERHAGVQATEANPRDIELHYARLDPAQIALPL